MKTLLTVKPLHMLVLFALIICFAPQLSFAAINPQIPFFGTLQDSTGTNLDGTYDMVFRFYDAPTGGTLLDTSTHTTGNGNPVTVSNGEFSVQLGSGAGNALDGIDFNTSDIYVGLTVNGDSEMLPRERLGASAYSFNTELIDGYDSTELLRFDSIGTVTDTSPSTLFTITQLGTGDIFNVLDGTTEVLTIVDGGNVGISTTTPTRTLTVAGDLQLTDAFYDSTNSAGIAGMVMQSNGASGVRWVATSSLGISGGGGGGSSLFTDGGNTTYLTSTTDNLSIGSLSASSKLNVVTDSTEASLGDIEGANFSITIEPSSGTYGSLTGIRSETNVRSQGTRTTDTVRGIESLATMVQTVSLNEAAVDDISSFYGGVRINNSAPVINASGLTISNQLNGDDYDALDLAGPLQNVYGAQLTNQFSSFMSASTTYGVRVNTLGGTTDDFYGLYIDSLTTTVNQDAFGVYVADASISNYFAGSLELPGISGGTLQTDALGNVTASSDERLKDIAGTYLSGLQEILAIDPISYRWNELSGYDKETLYAGFSAQNVEDVLPEAVNENRDGFKTLSTQPVLAAVVNSIKSLWETDQDQEDRISALEDRIAELESQITSGDRANVTRHPSSHNSGDVDQSDDTEVEAEMPTGSEVTALPETAAVTENEPTQDDQPVGSDSQATDETQADEQTVEPEAVIEQAPPEEEPVTTVSSDGTNDADPLDTALHTSTEDD